MTTRDEFSYRAGSLACEGIDLLGVAEAHGTPAYVYSRRAILTRFHAYEDALVSIPHRICYSVKANSNLSVLAALAREGAGFDIVSGGELYRVLSAGGDAASVVFSGVGKTEDDIRFALQKGIHSFNCESEAEIELLSRNQLFRSGKPLRLRFASIRMSMRSPIHIYPLAFANTSSASISVPPKRFIAQPRGCRESGRKASVVTSARNFSTSGPFLRPPTRRSVWFSD